MFSGLEDLENKLAQKLKALTVEVNLVFSNVDAECFAEVPIMKFSQQVLGPSTATSIRVKVTTGSEIY